MARPSASKDYTDRTVDLALFPGLAVSGVPSSMAIGPDTRVISGPSKACQKFLIVLMTQLGSDPVRPTMGTGIPAMLRSGQIFVSPGQVEQVFNVEAMVAVNYLASVRKSGQPLDEIVTQAKLKSYVYSGTTLSLSISVTMADGSTNPILLPVIWQP